MSVNEKMTAIADSIRGYTTITKPLSLDEMPSGINDVYNSGYSVGYTTGFGEGKAQGIDEGYNTATEEINVELSEIISIQESYIYPTILFYFSGTEYRLQESEAYWTDKLSFPVDWDPYVTINIYNQNGYAIWDMYSIEDSEGNLVKYSASIKNNEDYILGSKIEFTIKTNDGNTYLITSLSSSVLIMASDLPYSDSRFVYDDDSNLYFTPEENGKKYFIQLESNDIYLGDVISAILVEGGNE